MRTLSVLSWDGKRRSLSAALCCERATRCCGGGDGCAHGRDIFVVPLRIAEQPNSSGATKYYTLNLKFRGSI